MQTTSKTQCARCGTHEGVWFGGLCRKCNITAQEDAVRHRLETQTQEPLPKIDEERMWRWIFGIGVALFIGWSVLSGLAEPTPQITTGDGWARACMDGRCVTTSQACNGDTCVEVVRSKNY